MKSLLSINEFSKLSGLEITTLRYWDEIDLFSPAVRNPENNYRYYSPEQIIAVKFINVLSTLGVPLKELAVLKHNQDPKSVYALFAKQSKQINEELRRLQEALAVINVRQEFINLGLDVLDEPYTDISVSHEAPFSFVCGPLNTWKEGEGFYDPFVNFLNHANDLRINLNLPVGGIHETWEKFMESPGEPDYFFSVDIHGNRQSDAGNYMHGFARGYYGDFGDLNERMAAYAKEKALKPTGPVYAIYLLDEICYDDPAQYLSQTLVAVSK